MDNKQAIYLDRNITVAKVAGAEIRMTDDSEKWPVQVASMLHKSVPYLTNYAVQIELDRVNDERGYAYGTAKVSNKYEKPNADSRSAIIPIIIKDRMLKPFDIFIIEDKKKPLTEEALNSFLFRTETVEMTDRKPTDRDTTMQWTAPTDRFSAFGNIRGRMGGVGGSATMKMASILDIVTPPRAYVEKLATSLGSSYELKTALFNNPAFASSIEKVLSSAPEAPVDEQFQPSCAQVEKLDRNTFSLTTAHKDAYDPEQVVLSTKEAAEIIGDLAYRMKVGEALTYIDDPVIDRELPFYQPVEKVGYYSCVASSQKNIVDGAVVKISYFNGGDSWLFIGANSFAIQNELVGVKTAEVADLGLGVDGTFGIFTSNEWSSEPLQIEYMVGNTYHCKTATQNIKLTEESAITYPVKIASATWLIPPSDFVSLPKNEISLEDDANKTLELTAIKTAATALRVSRYNDIYTIDGAPVSNLKLGELSQKQAQFILGVCGLQMPEIEDFGSVLFKNAHTVVTKQSIKDVMSKEAASLVKYWPEISVDLTKMASLLQDGDTIDSVLSLGMITPDTVIEFINGIPKLEDSADKLADLLLHIRVGMSTVPEVAVEACMRNLVQIIKKLKELKEQGVINT
jgi:hypothetical protein